MPLTKADWNAILSQDWSYKQKALLEKLSEGGNVPLPTSDGDTVLIDSSLQSSINLKLRAASLPYRLTFPIRNMRGGWLSKKLRMFRTESK